MRYRRSFVLPASWKWPERCAVRLHFGAVDWAALVFVNGVRVGFHTGGFVPFSFDIDGALSERAPGPHAKHWVEVLVYDPTDRASFGQPLGKQRSLSGGIFYTAVSGIWGTVWLEPLPIAASIASLRITYHHQAQPGPAPVDARSHRFGWMVAHLTVRPSLRHTVPTPANLSVHVTMRDPVADRAASAPAGVPGNAKGEWGPVDSPVIAEGSCTLPVTSHSKGTVLPAAEQTSTPLWKESADGRVERSTGGDGDDLGEAAHMHCQIRVPLRHRPTLWTPESPALHGVVGVLLDGRSRNTVDSVHSYAGLRTVGVARGADGVARLTLNGRARFMAGVLDQGYWPDGLYTAPSDEALQSDLMSAKKFGFDLVRKHAKVEPARWYYHADRLGLLVWQDMPSPPALTCASSADGDDAWKRNAKAARRERQLGGSGDASRGQPPREAAEGAYDEEELQMDPPLPRCPLDGAAFERELKAIVDFLSFSPSVSLWVLFNEAWGQHNTSVYVRMLRSLDHTRLITDSSGWFLSGLQLPNSGTWLARHARKVGVRNDCSGADAADCGDVIDVHAYQGPRPRPRVRKRWFTDAGWQTLNWSHDSKRASVVGEFGGIHFKVDGHMHGPFGWGYGKAPQNCTALTAEMTQLWHNVANTTGLAAGVYTQLADIEAEWNGLLTYDRLVKCPDILPKQLRHAVLAARRALSPL